MEAIKRWSIQILEGLKYLHTRTPPIIHRDLKCSNIFIDGKTSKIMIGDLGLSKRRWEGAQMSIAGTPEFMALKYLQMESMMRKSISMLLECAFWS